MRFARATLLAVITTVSLPTLAYAAPGNTATEAGTGKAVIIEPLTIVADDDLRFGQFVQPTSAGTLTIASDGGVTAAGGMLQTYNLPQTGTGRGPATFHLDGTPNRMVIVNRPNRIDISNGTSAMRVDRFTDNIQSASQRLDNNGYFHLFIGARLNVSANQEVGTYSGTYDISVIYQ